MCMEFYELPIQQALRWCSVAAEEDKRAIIFLALFKRLLDSTRWLLFLLRHHRFGVFFRSLCTLKTHTTAAVACWRSTRNGFHS